MSWNQLPRSGVSITNYSVRKCSVMHWLYWLQPLRWFFLFHVCIGHGRLFDVWNASRLWKWNFISKFYCFFYSVSRWFHMVQSFNQLPKSNEGERIEINGDCETFFFIYRTTTMFGFDVIALENQFVNLKNVKVAKLWLIFLFIFVFNFAKWISIYRLSTRFTRQLPNVRINYT